jgi:CheY-like chemotaxis protein
VFERKRLLVVDDSRTMLELLRTVLAPIHREVLTAADVAGACAALDARPDLDFVLCDVVLPDGSGFDVLAHARGNEDTRAEVALMTARWSEEDCERARESGALAYLSKPVSLPDIRRAWSERAERRPLHPRSPRRRVVLRASVVGAGDEGGLLRLVALDLSRTGAFLATPGPLELGAKLELALGDPAAPVRVVATVVRVQEPTWQDPSGVGVRFEAVEESSREAFERLVSDPDAWKV